MSRFLASAAGLVCSLIAACGGSGDGGNGGGSSGCSVAREKRFVLDSAREWYLFRDQLQEGVDPDQYATAAEYLDALTADARADGKDRFFSYVTTREEDDAILQEGQFVGFGFRSHIEGSQLWLTDVYEGSPAAAGGLVRGAEITHLDSGDGFVPMATVLEEDPNLAEAFGPATVGLERGMRFVPPGGTSTESVFAKEVVTIPPVPADGVQVLALPANPAVPVGYLGLRTFTTTAEAPLREAYADFRAQGIENFIVDLRYNGGGLVRVAELIGDLNGLGRAQSDVYLNQLFNPAKSGQDHVKRFDPQAESVAPVRIAFITTGMTASASEIVVNSLAPWAEVAIVGEDTLGKPVGQSAFDASGCDLRLRLVAFRFTNADGNGDYYEGLAGSLPFACRAADDLTERPGDPAETSTSEALAWLGSGACGEILPPGRQLKAASARRIPHARHPSAVQSYLPGIF
ncbi:MAG TPA: S41 family peptidase [Steroidobacteraceae bacterium]|nr:S41 family peptidase [Steroidobacteraceae bacterium]